jgi:hypothetical protein
VVSGTLSALHLSAVSAFSVAALRLPTAIPAIFSDVVEWRFNLLMNVRDFLNEATIGLALLATVAALVAVVVVAGAESVGATGLRDVALALVGALAGTKVPSNGNKSD